MSTLKLHIVAFDVPFPPDYGGAIDVFYKVKKLSEAGVDIYLHCPVYGDRKPAAALEALCKQVWYYPRRTGIRGLSLTWPYMVYSRKHPDLLRNLLKVDAPVFFDGLSTTGFLSAPALQDRLKILRPQNVEQDYYRQLAKREKHLLKRIYYELEALLIRRYESRLSAANAFFTVAQHDHEFFKKMYPAAEHEYLPSFQPYDEIATLQGNGDFILYHGNLALAENREAALFLLQKVFPFIDFPCVVAGRHPDEELIKIAGALPHCRLVANPGMEEMEQLIAGAQIHVLPTFQNTGLKLKLLHALFKGRHIVVNPEMVHGTGLEEACRVCEHADSFIATIQSLARLPVNKDLLEKRKSVLMRDYDNRRNANRIVTYLRQKSL